MLCPICEAPVFENMRTPCEKFDGLWYHAACLYEERPDLKPEPEPATVGWCVPDCAACDGVL